MSVVYKHQIENKTIFVTSYCSKLTTTKNLFIDLVIVQSNCHIS